MKAIKIELVMEDDENAVYFITQKLTKKKKEYNLKQVHYSKCEYFEK